MNHHFNLILHTDFLRLIAQFILFNFTQGYFLVIIGISYNSPSDLKKVTENILFFPFEVTQIGNNYLLLLKYYSGRKTSEVWRNPTNRPHFLAFLALLCNIYNLV